MTLGRRGREPAPRERPLDAGWTSVELEELPAQPVLGVGRRRPPLGPVLGALGVTALLAVGLGVFGGNEPPLPSGLTAGATASATTSSGPADASDLPRSAPIETPAVACGPIAAGAPLVFFDVGGESTRPFVDEIEIGSPQGPTATSWTYHDLSAAPRMEVRADAVATISVAGDACAVSWSIDLIDASGSINLESVDNPSHDPLAAQQNRFSLTLARYRGRDVNLDVRLSFGNIVRRGIWPIRILPFDLPNVSLHRGSRSIDLAPGCDLSLGLGNGYRELLTPCFGSVHEKPVPARVAPGAALVFGFGDGWTLSFVGATCGVLDEGTFAAEGEDRCRVEAALGTGPPAFAAPDTPGERWTLAFNGCGQAEGSHGPNEVCGTWYATIEVAG